MNELKRPKARIDTYDQEIVKVSLTMATSKAQKKTEQLQIKQKKLIEAAQKDRYDLKDQTGFLYSVADAQKKDKHNKTALFYACFHLNYKFVSYLLKELKGDPNQRCHDQ